MQKAAKKITKIQIWSLAVGYECSVSMLKEKPAENILLVPGEHITKRTRFFEIFLTK